MSDSGVKITIIQDGPIKVDGGPVQITLSDGTVKEKKSPLFLCRCGESKNKPLCDGTHKNCGFKG